MAWVPCSMASKRDIYRVYTKEYLQGRGATRIYGNCILRHFIWGHIYDKHLKKTRIQNLPSPIPVAQLNGPFYLFGSSLYCYLHFIIQRHVKRIYIRIKHVTSVLPHTPVFYYSRFPRVSKIDLWQEIIILQLLISFTSAKFLLNKR